MRITGRVWRGTTVESTTVALADLPSLAADPDRLLWADLASPDESTLATLARALAIDPAAVEDALGDHERVALHRYAHHWTIVAYTSRLEAIETKENEPKASETTANGPARKPNRLKLRKSAVRGSGDQPTDTHAFFPYILNRVQVSAFVLPHALITIHTGEFDTDSLLSRLSDDPNDLEYGAGALVHAFLDTIVDGHFETLQALDDVVDDAEDLVFSGQADPDTFPQTIHRIRSELAQLRRVVLPMREVVAGIQRHRLITGALEAAREPGPRRPGRAREARFAGALEAGSDLEARRDLDADREDVAPALLRAALGDRAGQLGDAVTIAPGLDPLFDDLYDHVLRAMEWTDSLRDLVSSVFETNLSLQDARLNQVMKKLAGWAAVIAVPTAITGWFGQNIPFWGANDVSGLIASVALIVVLGVGVYALLRHYDWI